MKIYNDSIKKIRISSKIYFVQFKISKSKESSFEILALKPFCSSSNSFYHCFESFDLSQKFEVQQVIIIMIYDVSAL